MANGNLYCPQCSAVVVLRERRPNGNDRCDNGHEYPSKLSRKACPRDTDGDGNCGNPTCVHCRQKQYGLKKVVDDLVDRLTGKVKDHQFEQDVLGLQTCLCEICGGITSYAGTRRCNRCWELEKRITSDPHLARKILENLECPKR